MKGWLEMRPSVWTDFIEDIKMIEEDEKYIKAINGETEIECFNDWVNELKNFNYLHNHTRMLFASIWIFTLGLPWQKGAEFFMKHLYDGDAAFKYFKLALGRWATNERQALCCSSLEYK